MMPEMDGIETTKALRSMGYTAPIVALTANAVSGQAEEFLANGFDDFLSKPVDIRQMNVILNRLIRDKQPPEVIEEARKLHKPKPVPAAEQKVAADSPAVDPSVETQQAASDKKVEASGEFVEIFIRDAEKSLSILEGMTKNGGTYGGDLRTYIIHMHGLKSALTSIGNDHLSAIAFKLEGFGRDENLSSMESATPMFLSTLRTYVGELTEKDRAADGETEGDTAFLHEMLQAVKTACEDYNVAAAEEVLAKLKNTAWPQPVKETLSKISGHLLHSEFNEAKNAIAEYMFFYS
jgi:CheY-like chemotaxis protein